MSRLKPVFYSLRGTRLNVTATAVLLNDADEDFLKRVVAGINFCLEESMPIMDRQYLGLIME